MDQLHQLPPEILYHISSYLPLKDVFLISQLNIYYSVVTKCVEYSAPFNHRAEKYVRSYILKRLQVPKLALNIDDINYTNFARYSELINPYFGVEYTGDNYLKENTNTGKKWSKHNTILFIEIVMRLIQDDQKYIFQCILQYGVVRLQSRQSYCGYYTRSDLFNSVFLSIIDIPNIDLYYIDTFVNDIYILDCWYMDAFTNEPIFTRYTTFIDNTNTSQKL